MTYRIKRAFYRWLNSEGNPISLLLLMALGVASFGILLAFLTFQGPAFKPSPPQPMVANSKVFSMAAKPIATDLPEASLTRLKDVVSEAVKVESTTPQAGAEPRVQVKGSSTQPKLRELVNTPRPLTTKPQQKSLLQAKPPVPPAPSVALKPDMPQVGNPGVPTAGTPVKTQLPNPAGVSSAKAVNPAALGATVLSKSEAKSEKPAAKNASQSPALPSNKPSGSPIAPAVAQVGSLPVSVHIEVARTAKASSDISFGNARQAGSPDILWAEPLIEEPASTLAESTALPPGVVEVKPLACPGAQQEEEAIEAASLDGRDCMLP